MASHFKLLWKLQIIAQTSLRMSFTTVRKTVTASRTTEATTLITSTRGNIVEELPVPEPTGGHGVVQYPGAILEDNGEFADVVSDDWAVDGGD